MLGSDRTIYVLDTNVLVDYPNIIPGKDKRYKKPEDATINFAGQHIVIPGVVRHELGKFKGEDTPRGGASATVLRRLRPITGASLKTLAESYNMEATRDIGDNTLLTLMPLHPDFKKALPFQPDENDMDGQILLTVLGVIHLVAFWKKVLEGPGTERTPEINWKDRSLYHDLKSENVVLVTNDNEMAVRAHDLGIPTDTFGYNIRQYTGRRDIIVPNEVFHHFWNNGTLENDIWCEHMPKEAPLVANEFVIMTPTDLSDGELPMDYLTGSDGFFRHIGRYDADKGAIVHLQHTDKAPYSLMNDGQAILNEALFEPSISAIICTGPAGSGKTFIPTVFALSSIARKIYGRAVIVPCRSRGDYGALPGDLDAKMMLDTGPFRNAIRNYLKHSSPRYRSERTKKAMEENAKRTIDDLVKETLDDDAEPVDLLDEKVEMIWKRHFKNIPVDSAQGLDFSGDLACCDEFQDQSPADADMLIKRLGADGKIVITGDIKQIHARYVNETSNGITYATGLLYDQPMVARISLLKDEVVRHELVKIIAEKQEEKQKTP